MNLFSHPAQKVATVKDRLKIQVLLHLQKLSNNSYLIYSYSIYDLVDCIKWVCEDESDSKTRILSSQALVSTVSNNGPLSCD